MLLLLGGGTVRRAALRRPRRPRRPVSPRCRRHLRSASRPPSAAAPGGSVGARGDGGDGGCGGGGGGGRGQGGDGDTAAAAAAAAAERTRPAGGDDDAGGGGGGGEGGGRGGGGVAGGHASGVVARTLREAGQADPADVVALDLRASASFVCKNVFCESVGGACVCRFGLWLSQHPLPALAALSLQDNGLTQLPDALWDLGTLRHLDLRDNRLAAVPAEGVLRLRRLETLDLRGNPGGAALLPPDARLRADMPALREVLRDS
jgi:hypothetical protein